MQFLGGRFLYSATDLNNYLECAHLIALSRKVASGELERPERQPTAALIAKKGAEHEKHYLERLRAEYPGLVEIPDPTADEWAAGPVVAVERAAAQTEAAMRDGAPIIYQGTFYDGTFLGKADFLLRVETPSPALGAWSYEVADTKLALHEKPYFVIQLCNYSEHLERVQGVRPKHMHVVLGSETVRTFRVDDFFAYYRHLKASFLARGVDADAYPFKCGHCAICDFAPQCAQRREDDDHLSLVAWMRRDQVGRLENGGISTLSDLAQSENGRPHGMQETTFARLRKQAALQHRERTTGKQEYELLQHGPYEGFALMPAPAEGDVFFDMEGDPYFEIGDGLEYLFGCYVPDDEPAFRAFWGTDRPLEKRAFEQCIDFFMERRKRYPAMRIYHYAPYEKTALRKLSQMHGTREDEVDELLRGEVLVDLYAVVRQALMISKPSYSIKKLESYYGLKRASSVKRGDDSVLMFEQWRTEGDDAILRDIEAYNEEDCRSTWMLREWLLRLRDEWQQRFGTALAFKAAKDPEAPCHEPPQSGCSGCARREREEREKARLVEAQRALFANETDPDGNRLAHLLSYYRREANPEWWAFFDRCENIDRLTEFDKDAIGGLRLCDDVAPYPDARSFVYTYAFPPQEHHLPKSVVDPQTRKTAGTVVAIDDDACRIAIKRTGTMDDARALTALIPGGPIRTDELQSSLGRLAQSYIAGTFEKEHPAAADLLFKLPPRFRARARGAVVQPAVVSIAAVHDLVAELEGSYLFVQGPPGTGKTYIGARVILNLLAAGKRVGITANSHKAIHNLLTEIERAWDGTTVLRGVHKHADEDSTYVSVLEQPLISSSAKNDVPESGAHNLVSGTAWLFAREGMQSKLDYLFVDEAGQVALANVLAASPSAKNIVLLGDPMQLAQVSKGIHACGAGNSVLEHLLGNDATVAENRGVLLDTSYRMHPAICRFISDAVYDGRLHAHASTSSNRIASPGLSGSGLRTISISHTGNARASSEEAQRIVAEVGELLRGTVVRNDEPERPLTQRDILVVTPYNAQRKRIENALQAAGFGDVLVGTVDKFQGRQAPVVFYSMATSSGAEMPRSMEFLFEKNRFNVAISRAQCLSVLVCSPALLDVRCSSVEQMALVNLLCRYVDASEAADDARLPVSSR